jgi:hypothetical protein
MMATLALKVAHRLEVVKDRARFVLVPQDREGIGDINGTAGARSRAPALHR